MPPTTVKVSTDTRDRIRSLGSGTLEETINEALDALEQQQFWAQAERAAEWRAKQSPDWHRRREEAESSLDAAFDGIG